MIDPSLALFAIEAGVRLGRKINEVLVDETAQRPLLMPLGDLFGSVTEAEAMRFFSVDQPDLIKPGGSCFEIRDDRAKLIQVYRAMRGVEAQVMAPASDLNARRKEIVSQLGALDQFDQNSKPDIRPPRSWVRRPTSCIRSSTRSYPRSLRRRTRET